MFYARKSLNSTDGSVCHRSNTCACNESHAMYASLDQGASKSCSRGSKASGDAAGEGCDDARPADSASTIVRSIVSVVMTSSGFDVRVGLRRSGCSWPRVRVWGAPVIVGGSRLIFGIDGIEELFRCVHGHVSVFLESADVEMRHLLSLCSKFAPGFVGNGMRELIVSELGPARAWRIPARSVRLNW